MTWSAWHKPLAGCSAVVALAVSLVGVQRPQPIKQKAVPAKQPEPKEQVLPVMTGLPGYIHPFGPRNVTQFPQLVELKGKTVEEYRAATGAVWGIPPVYYDLVTGRVIGFAAIDGKPLSDYIPQNAEFMATENRILVLIRRVPKRFAHNLWWVDEAAVLAAAEKGMGWKWIGKGKEKRMVWGMCYRDVNATIVRKLGIDITKFNVVVMHKDDCVYPGEAHERSGLIGTSRSLKAFSWARMRGTLAAVCRIAGPGAVILFGDGGETIQPPKRGRLVRRPPLGLMFYEFKKRRK